MNNELKYMYYICNMLINTKHAIMRCVLLLVSTIAYVSAVAQEFIEKPQLVFDVDDYSFFDNREVRSPYQRSQTLFGSLLSVEGGIQFGTNTILAGGYAIKDFGQSGLAKQAFTFYYYYEQGHITGAFGSFPRKRLRRELPDIFVYDSLRYYTPILHGALIQYTNDHGYAEFYCNWLNRQGVGEREIFELVTDGRFGIKGYYAGWNIQLTHFSVPRPANGLHVYDKLMINPHIGIERSNIAWFDALHVEAGLMLSLNRDRTDEVWKSPMGFLGEARMRKWRFELRNLLYAGNPQFSDFEKYGSLLHRGDPYFRSSLYNRTDIHFYLLNKTSVQCFVSASFHYTEGAMDNSQQVILRLYPKF